MHHGTAASVLVYHNCSRWPGIEIPILFEPLYHRSCGAAESIEGLDKKISLQKRVSI